MIAIIDYGVGNLRSVQKGFERFGYQSLVTDDPATVIKAQGVVLPGVGAFAAAMASLKRTGMGEAICQVVERGKPFLGICLGLQMLFELSEENGCHLGFGLLPGKVRRLPPMQKVPHMGWNSIEMTADNHPLWQGIPSQASFYFVHSYYVDPEDRAQVLAWSNYGIDFAAAVGRGNVMGVQFHPEKSSCHGLQLLKNFGEMVIK
ncbi:MAG: imidazole glycerol phosphate synthase subunit HisH [Syntrophomonadaceae bacterium]|jgi:glutamine amidotransferase|nr:imidazole glycerol phosphate synthase subunit HisH [Syntrophomonadaceae bacterium]